jgi:Protein of unknown function (DUF2752)
VESGRQIAVLWGVVAMLCLAMAPLASLAAPIAEAKVFSCPVKVATGLPCPTCGGTRATLALARLSPREALAANPAVTLGWLAVVLGGLVAMPLAFTGRPLPTLPRRLPVSVRLAAVALVVANWVYLYKAGI